MAVISIPDPAGGPSGISERTSPRILALRLDPVVHMRDGGARLAYHQAHKAHVRS